MQQNIYKKPHKKKNLNLIVNFSPEQNEKSIRREEGKTWHIKHYMSDNLKQQVINQHNKS